MEGFIQTFREIKIEEEDVLISFNIEYLYLSIGKEEITETVSRKIK